MQQTPTRVQSHPSRATLNRVLITGFPRSGTTFVGQALSLPSRVAYLHEPLNPQCGLPAPRRPYADLDDPEWADLAAQMSDLLELRGRLRGAVYPSDTQARRLAKRVVRGRGPAHLHLARLPPRPRHVVVKDPFALATIPWFTSQGCHVILLVRHPAAVVASFERLGWRGKAAHRQLTKRYEFLDDQERRWFGEGLDRTTAVSLLWRVLHRRALEQLDDTAIVVHEAVSRDPMAEFDRLRTRTGLPGTWLADREIRRLTSGRTAAAHPGRRTQQFRRASAGILDATLSRLDDEEIDRIWDITGEIAGRWYARNGVR